MWVRFWCENISSAGPIDTSRDESYEWMNDRETDESLQEYAEERVPPWMDAAGRGCRCGYERLVTLPENVRVELVKKYVKMRMHAESMLELLRG